jgi:hypothetical protein
MRAAPAQANPLPVIAGIPDAEEAQERGGTEILEIVGPVLRETHPFNIITYLPGLRLSVQSEVLQVRVPHLRVHLLLHRHRAAALPQEPRNPTDPRSPLAMGLYGLILYLRWQMTVWLVRLIPRAILPF